MQHAGGRPGHQTHSAVLQEDVVHAVFGGKPGQQGGAFQQFGGQFVARLMAEIVKAFATGHAFPGKAGQRAGRYDAQDGAAQFPHGLAGLFRYDGDVFGKISGAGIDLQHDDTHVKSPLAHESDKIVIFNRAAQFSEALRRTKRMPRAAEAAE